MEDASSILTLEDIMVGKNPAGKSGYYTQGSEAR
jgi:hypothetical protein